MSTTTRLITADELEEMPHRDEQGNDCRLELIRGEVKMMPLVKPLYGVVCARITTALINFVESDKLGMVFGAETGFIVERDPDTVLGPDVAFVSRDRLAAAKTLEAFFPFAPDIAVEFLRSDTTEKEYSLFIDLYLAAGARAVWLFGPKLDTAAIFTSPTDVVLLRESDTLDGGDVLPGFRLELSKLFAGLK
jgi:Uma2 family endonuclease